MLADDEELLRAVLGAGLHGLRTVLLPVASDRFGRMTELVRGAQLGTFAVATSAAEALAAQEAGADAVIAKGHEAGGWIGEEGTFILLQRLIGTLRIPVWAHGGIGVHTAAAAYASGAVGAVLDAQLLLTRESPVSDRVRSIVATMDGSETTVLGSELGRQLRVYSRPRIAAVEALRQTESRLTTAQAGPGDWHAAVKRCASAGGAGGELLPLGQDAAFAPDLARRFETVAGIVAGLKDAVATACVALQRGSVLAEGAPLARSHGTRYPIAQGPMTRVSDRAEFAAAVGDAGALPFLALALMRAPEADALLGRTRELLGDSPWGVGILGFVPPELRAEQLAVVRAHRPPFALIAGGRPDQARELEADGITTYLHVPSPGLLKLYLADGARRFIFEGRECGGHVGPRTSFVLWDTMLRVLLEELSGDASDCHVLFAGGIHDARSAAMVAAMAATAADRGIRVGSLLGTAYIFTREATKTGAITPSFQRAVTGATETVLVESGPGHATRCLRSPFVEQFEVEKRRTAGLSAEEQRGRLEQLNIGRLRIAAKGTDRNPRSGSDVDAPKLVKVKRADQWERGLYMIGQVAALRDRVTTLAQLHRDVSDGSSEVLAAITPPEEVVPAAPPPADVAIIGLACVLPGAHDLATFWANILGKVDAITEVPRERWDWHRMYDEDPNARDKVYSRWGGFIDPVAFDPVALGLPPKSLSSIEPFQLLALLTAREALRDAGYASRPFHRERTSVVLGAGGGGADLAVGYTVRSALPSLLGDAAPDLQEQLYEHLPEWTEDSFPGLLMNVAAGRIANRLDFGGANYTVDAACASSLAAIALGVRELQSGTSDMVLAGGVDAIQNPFAYLCFSKTRALSPRGRCRPFDAQADGIAISEGVGVIVLKRLADAERDGDRIYAVIRGVAAASDGRDRSLTAPRPEGQMRALRRAYAQARVSPATVGLVEAHGTGTVAGDGAEVEALTSVFGKHEADRQACAVGSVKSMIGHTKATAGVAGVMKAALALHHRVLPPTIGVSEPNPKANFADSPFYVNSETRPWLSGGAEHPRRAGVSAFGFGGTNFHAVLEEYTGGYVQASDATGVRWPAELLVWRGTRSEIAAAVQAFAAQLDEGAEFRLEDLAWTLALEAGAVERGRATLAMVAESIDDLREKLHTARELLAGDAERLHSPHGVHWAEHPLAADGRVAVLFPGQGSQTVDMAREVTIAFPEAREPFERADRVLATRYEQPLSRYVFPPPSFTREEQQRRQTELTDTHVAQAALGATDLAYLRVLRALGVEPDLTAGHSYGELVALAAAGSLDEDELLRLSEARGRYMAEAADGEPGAMAAVDAPPDRLEPLLTDGTLVAANLNAPEQTVLSGPRERIDAALQWCREHDLRARALPVACAFHSPHVAAAQRRFAERLERATIAAPRIPVYSNTTADAHGQDPSAITQVLAQQLVGPVEFVREIEAMYRDGARIFVEAGPRAVLSGLVGQILGERAHVAAAVDRPGGPRLAALLHCLAALAAEGVPVRTERLFRGRPVERVDLRSVNRCQAHPRGTWLVDGGRIRPADAPPAGAPSIPNTSLQEQPLVTSTITSTNGSGSLVPGSPLPLPASTAESNGAHQPAAIPLPPVDDRVGEVMTHYHRVMQQFLETQRDVMLGYLGAAPAAPTDWLSLPRRAPQPLAAPPPGPPPLERPSPDAGPEPPARTAAPESPAMVAVDERPPEPTSGAAGAAAGNGHVAISGEEIRERLLSIVSERTGYPGDMLSLDADLEGDLGIDSIKRVEIAGTLTQALGLNDRVSIDVEQLTASRTLREVITTLEQAVGAGGEAHSSTSASDAEEALPFERGPAEEERIGRFVVQAASAPAITASGGLAADGAVVIVDDERGVGEALADALVASGHAVVRVPGASTPEDGEEATRLLERAREHHGRCKALIHLGALADAPPAYGGLAGLLTLVQAVREDLEAAAAAGGAAVLGATRLGGAFGIGGPAPERPADQGALRGFLKTLALEWPDVRVKGVDLSSGSPPEEAQQLLAELMTSDGLVEVGYRGGERTQLTLVPEPVAGRDGSVPVDGESVLLVTGGARGITAEAALTLARDHRPTLVLVGRTAPDEEDPETAAVTELPELRRAMIEARRRNGQELAPALVEQDCRRLLRAREACENLRRMRATGAHVEYSVCDVSDSEAFGALIDDVYERYGRIDGVLHGAGVIEDRLVRDKQPDSLRRVLETKAGAAQTLAEKLRPESLRFLVLFSSVSGRFGNRGQADYAAASEVLTTLAHDLDRRWNARVVAVDWGPWRARGMVSEALEQEFARRGVALIPVDVGCRVLADELTRGRKGEAEVVIGAATGLTLTTPAAGTAAPAAALPLLVGRTEPSRATDGGVELLRSLHLAHDWYLRDHRVDGRPVLPFAVAMEAMAEAAAATAPSRTLAGLRGIRVLKGVVVDSNEGTAVRICAMPASSDELEVTITAADGGRVHYRAAVALRDPGTAARLNGTPAALDKLAPFPMDIGDAYRELLFHGPLFQGIVGIEGMDERGSTALLRASDAGHCVADAAGLEWLLDPVMLDSALQVQVVWARLLWDVTLLPAEIGRYTYVARPSHNEPVRHELRIRPDSNAPLCHADHWFYGADGRLLATLEDVVGVGSKALNRLAQGGT